MTKFGKAIRRFGEDSFEIRALFESDDEALLYEREKYFISVYKKHGPVWNMTPGGKGWMPKRKRRRRPRGKKGIVHKY